MPDLMASSAQPPVDLDLITSLANRFAALRMNAEATELYELALRLEPTHRGVQLALGRVRQDLRADLGDEKRDLEAAIVERQRRDSIDASHFHGLARLYEERGKAEPASECLEIALAKKPVHPAAFALRGRLLFQARDYDGAERALRTARRFDPFDRHTAELLGRTERERGQYREALEETIDSFLLLREDHLDDAQRLKKRIRELKERLTLDSETLIEVFRERRLRLQTHFDRLELQRERWLESAQPRVVAASESDDSGRIRLAARLRQLDAWTRLTDEQIFELTRVVREEEYDAGDTVFEYRGRGADLYLLASGHVRILRPTHYGKYTLAVLEPGTLFGEVNFIAPIERSGHAIAEEPTQILRLDAAGLHELIERRPDLGVKIYTSFWQGLAIKLRNANEQLRTFFTVEEPPPGLLTPSGAEGPEGVDVATADKVELLREQGLTGAELQTLADFSNVKRFPAGAPLFHEGDPGSEMYVVLDGQVLISKYIPGAGEEALAVLERGDFFGEMALIDGQPRSADARSHEGPVTVIAFDELTLKEVQAVDPRASIDFIRLLCHLMATRLREIDEKVIGWRIMSGDRGEDASASFEFPRLVAETA